LHDAAIRMILLGPAITLIAVSFPIGILIGVTGIGGAALMTPFLILVLGARPDLAVGTDLAYSMFTKAAGAWLHWRQGHVDLRLVGKLAAASLPGAILGTFTMTRVYHGAQGDARLKAVIGLVLLVVAAVSIWRPRKPSEQVTGTRLTLATLAYAGVAGFLVGLTSIGSGSLILPLLMIVNRLAVVRAVGTDIFHAAILVAFSSALHASVGQVNWAMVPWLLAGSIPGVVLGSRLAPRLPERTVRFAVLAVLLVSAFKLLF
jgi:uncharacterized membrane protein YfcA